MPLNKTTKSDDNEDVSIETIKAVIDSGIADKTMTTKSDTPRTDAAKLNFNPYGFQQFNNEVYASDMLLLERDYNEARKERDELKAIVEGLNGENHALKETNLHVSQKLFELEAKYMYLRSYLNSELGRGGE